MKIIIAFTALFLASCGASTSTKDASDRLTAPSIEEVTIPSIDELASLEIVFADSELIPTMGAIATDPNSPNYGSVMYPAYSGASFLAAILVHAIVQGSVTAKENERRRTAADLVLEKYPLLSDGYIVEGLELSDEKVSVNDHDISLIKSELSDPNQVAGPLYAAVYPVLIMSQSEESLILQNEVRVYSVLQTETPLQTATVEIVRSQKCKEISAFECWARNDSENLKSAIQGMFLESIQLALAIESIQATADAGTSETVRYLEDGHKKVERGQVLEQSCNHLRFMTLRGVIKSVPLLEDTCQLSVQDSTTS